MFHMAVFLKVELYGATALAASQFKNCLSSSDPNQSFLPQSNSTLASILSPIFPGNYLWQGSYTCD